MPIILPGAPPAPPTPVQPELAALLDLNLAGHLDDSGFSWGSGTPWRVNAFSGLFTQALRTTDIVNSGMDGSSFGTDYLDVKSCMMTLLASPQETGLSYMTLVNQARSGLSRSRGTAVRQIWWDGLGYMMVGRVRAADPQIQVGQTHIELAVQFTAADGLLYSANLNTQTIGMTTVNQGGLTVPVRVPVSIGYSAALGTATCVNNGNENAYPDIYLYGPAVSPRITNLTTGQSIIVPITLSPNDFVHITTGPGTPVIMYNDNSLVIEDPNTSWWTLPPGSSVIEYDSSLFDASATAVINWRDTSS